MNSRVILCMICLSGIFSSAVKSQTPGSQKWAFATGEVVSSSPAIGNDGTIYIGSRDDKLYAIHADGKLAWAFPTRNDIYSSPAIGSDGTIYFGSLDSSLYAINQNGTKKWSFPAGHAVYGSAAVGNDGTIYFGSLDNKLYALNPDGTQKWSFTAGAWIRSSPAISSGGNIYFGSDDKKLYALYPDGTLNWSLMTGDGITSSPAIGHDGTIYFGSLDNQFYAVNPDGTQKWNVTVGGDIAGSPVIGRDGTVYFGSHDKKLYAINPDGTQKWVFSTGGIIFSSLAIGDDDIIYVGSYDRKLYAIDQDSKIKWTYSTGGDIYSSPAIASGGILYFGSWDKMVYALNCSSHGLADSPWPKFRNDNKNRGYSAALAVTAPVLDFVFVHESGNRSYVLNLANHYSVSITVDQCQFDHAVFSLVNSLPLSLPAGATATLTAVAPVSQNSWLSTRFELTFVKGSYSRVIAGNIQEGVFFEDGGEIALTAHRALNGYQACKALDAGSPATLNNLSVLLRLLGEDLLAAGYNEQAISKALNARDGYAGIKMNQGVIRSDQERPQDADSAYYSALKDVLPASVLFAQIYFNLAWEDYQADSLQPALTHVNMVLSALDVNAFLTAKAHVLRGAIYFRQENSGASISDFQQAVALDPSGPIGRMAQENLATDVAAEPQLLPREFALLPNFPNPFNPATHFQFALPYASDVSIIVYNLSGQQVSTILQEKFPAGWHEASWHGMDDRGRAVGTGIYILRMRAGEWEKTFKMSLIK